MIDIDKELLIDFESMWAMFSAGVKLSGRRLSNKQTFMAGLEAGMMVSLWTKKTKKRSRKSISR